MTTNNGINEIGINTYINKGFIMEIGKVLEKVSDYIDQKYPKSNGENNTKKMYLSCLKKFLFKHKSYTHLKDINDDIILKYLLSIPGRSNRCSHHSAIKMMFKVHGLKNKMRYIPYPEKEDKLPIHVNQEEFMRMLSVCDNKKHQVIICVLFDCGLRISELINLKITDIDSSNMLIHIKNAKGHKDRDIKLTSFLLKMLRDYYIQYKPKIYLLNGQKKDKYTVRSCQQVVKQLTIKAGIKKNFSPHKIRHGYAMNLLENGTTLDDIANQMGHKTTKTTEIYARKNNKIIQKIQSPLEQIAENIKLGNSLSKYKPLLN